VAVSVSAGVAAIISIPAFESARDHRVLLCLAFVALITVTNLRGIKESGRVFAIPTYLYIVMLTALIGVGLAESLLGEVSPVPFDADAFAGTAEAGGTLGLFLILKGFSSGAVALTGVEAIADGVPAFRKPQAKNAATTLMWMAIILGSLVLGTALLAERLHPYPSEHQTVIAQMGQQVFGQGPVFFLLQISTAMILALAANTAYADFPRLSSIIAGDGFLPRQFANRGDRLVFSNGILFLAGAASLLVVAFGGLTNALIPLYAVGVFTSFTLSQLGMVRYQMQARETRWRMGATISAVGAAATFTVLSIVLVTKFTSGGWLPVVVIPGIVLLFKGIRRHYDAVAEALAVEPGWRPPHMNHTTGSRRRGRSSTSTCRWRSCTRPTASSRSPCSTSSTSSTPATTTMWSRS
jgi:amino acid transporter